MSATNEMSEEQIHEALMQLAGRLTGALQVDLGAGPAPEATAPNQDAAPALPPNQDAPPAPAPNQDAAPAPPPSQEPEAQGYWQGLVQRAQQGDESVLPELGQILDANPECWQGYGDLALQAQEAWLRLISGQDLLRREALQRKVDQLKAELAGTDPSPLEKLLVERTTATWLQLQYADAGYAQAKVNSSSAQHQSIQRRQNSAQQRHLQALKMLVTVRKLLSPSQATGESQPRLFTPGAVG
jgi:hypothetical protein